MNCEIVPPEAELPGLDVEHAARNNAPTADKKTITEDVFLDLGSITYPFCRQQILVAATWYGYVAGRDPPDGAPQSQARHSRPEILGGTAYQPDNTNEHVNLSSRQTGDMSTPKASYITLRLGAVKGLAERRFGRHPCALTSAFRRGTQVPADL